MSRVVVSGAVANKPDNGGEAWVRMAWVRGLRRLGFEVWFVEQIDRGLLDGVGPADRSRPAEFFRRVVRQFDLEDRCALVDERGTSIVGARLPELEDLATEAEFLVNISGHLRIPSLLERFRCRAYIDVDPGFTQFWQASGIDGGVLQDHDVFFTVGLNVGRSDCTVPTGGLPWRPLPPPVVLEEWPLDPTGSDAFTTIASWRGSFGAVEHRGRTFGSKVHEFRRFIDLPARVSRPLEIALDIHPDDGRDLSALRRHGWRIVDPRRVAAHPDAYREYIRGSGAEFSVAQGIYVETNSGWFSDRTARYLACGRPALVQETGFSQQLPVGEGLVAFRTLEEATAGAECIARDYEAHCRRARELVEEYLDAETVLGRFVEDAGAGRQARP